MKIDDLASVCPCLGDQNEGDCPVGVGGVLRRNLRIVDGEGLNQILLMAGEAEIHTTAEADDQLHQLRGELGRMKVNRCGKL